MHLNFSKAFASLVKGIFTFGLLFIVLFLQAQDAQFSQYYANPLYANPAMAGSAMRQRAILNYRNQWPALSKHFVTSSASFDTYYIPWNAGLGAQVVNDRIGGSELQSTSLVLSYAPRIRIEENMYAQLGVGLGVGQRSLAFNNLVFADQYTDNGGFGPTQEAARAANKIYPQVSLGALIFKKNWFLGMSGWNLTAPRIDDISSGNSSRIRTRISFNGGYKIVYPKRLSTDPPRRKENGITPNAQIRFQGPQAQIDFGATANYEFLLLGVYARGIPLGKEKVGNFSQDVLSIMAGFYVDFLQFGYSYDINLQKIAGPGLGSHEISLIYSWELFRPFPKKKYSPLPCPEI
jgi:type IX secretion system PorP/SprF family membrane protein